MFMINLTVKRVTGNEAGNQIQSVINSLMKDGWFDIPQEFPVK